MEDLLVRQAEIQHDINRMNINFLKDSATRKSSVYIESKLEVLEKVWEEFQENHGRLEQFKETKGEEQYFKDNIFETTKKMYDSLKRTLVNYKVEKGSEALGTKGKDVLPLTENRDQKIADLLTQQRTNFRALYRAIGEIDIDHISEKWELEDELSTIQGKWKIIDNLHLQIDNFTQGGDVTYEDEFRKIGIAFKNIKRALNQKVSSASHKQESAPRLEIPTFAGNFSQWLTFYDLFSEAIHNNNLISKAQKMQHLKGKLKGEPERLVQHLHISADNYDAAWEILVRRYNNPQVLFTKQIEIFLNQPNIMHQTSGELKRFHDTTMECVHAIHNLGVDTNSWDPLLVHLLSKKLDSTTYSEYKEARVAPRELPTLAEFMDFLETKFTALEPIHKRERESSLVKSIGNQSNQYGKYIKGHNLGQRHLRHNQFHQKNAFGAGSNHLQQVNTNYLARTCPLCKQAHDLYRCAAFINLPAESKLKTIAKLEVCSNCLYSHFGNLCTSMKRCKLCANDHNTLLHDAYCRPSASFPIQQQGQGKWKSRGSMHATHPIHTPSSSTQPRQHQVNYVAGSDEEVLLTTLLIKVKSRDGTLVTLRALLDQGSQISLISDSAAQALGLQRKKYYASIAGVGDSRKQSRGIVGLECQSIHDEYSFITDALVVSRVLSSQLPNSSFRQQSWPHVQHLQLADPEYHISRPIDLLLDASVYSEIIMSGLIKGPVEAPIAQQTKLGWILSGNIRTFNCHVVINNLEEISQYWEMEDINLNTSTLTEEEQYCESFYQKTTKRLADGRYQVGLPMKTGFEEQIGLSKAKAVAQFNQLERKMSKNSIFSERYQGFMSEYEQLYHMRLVKDITHQPSCYLPHHGVLKLDSTTTKLRVVFNASSPTSSGLSLNDLMLCGANLQRDLQSLMLTWRQYRIVLTADIEKFYRQLWVRERDQHLQRILWRAGPQETLQEYQLATVTYGTKAAPFLALRTLQQLAEDVSGDYPIAAAAIKNSFYMDDLIAGADTVNQAKELQNQLIECMQGAGFNLRKWNSNYQELIQDLNPDQRDSIIDFKCPQSRKTLGLKWNPSTDTFSFSNCLSLDSVSHPITKRFLLSEISKIFDPLGWLSPLTIKAKLLFQKTWATGITWESELTGDITREWLQLKNDFRNIHLFQVSRYIGDCSETYQLHGFCDASAKAFAASVYLVTKDNKGQYTSELITAKTKLASDLSTPTFMAAFKRMCARRGAPQHMYSDNGTNFVGASKLTKQEYHQTLAVINDDLLSDMTDLGITWHFNAPAWPNAGGLWEAAVKSLKYHLKRVIGSQKLTFEEFTTLLAQIEACLNSRPLCALTENIEEIDYLTPGHFLVGGPLLSSPEPEPNNINIPTRWKLTQAIKRDFWKRWSAEYLHILQARSKWRKPVKNLEINDVVVIKEDNLPPAKWALGRVKEVHVGKDGHVRVVTLQTKNNTIKRPVNKLVILPVHEQVSSKDYDISKDKPKRCIEPNLIRTKAPPRRQRGRGITFYNMLCMTLLLFMSFLAPTMQVERKTEYNITTLEDRQGLFFETLSNLQHIKEDWRLVVYYNMTTYWQGMEHVKQYVNHLAELTHDFHSQQQYQSTVTQLQHEITEIEHYNTLLSLSHNHRRKRGLINGIGYVANSLFGVLDDRFAQQYKKDIEQVTRNENHLRNLLKNQTVVIEAEYNILRRNEQVMHQQFNYIKQHLKNLTDQIDEVRLDNQNAGYILSASLAATIIISNLRRIQHTLLDTVTDISQGHMDPRLLSPEQLNNQMDLIAGQLPSYLKLPVEKGSPRNLYKLMKAATTVYDMYLIIEIKIPIISNNVYELNKIISVPQKKGQSWYQITPSLPYLAYDIKTEKALFLTDLDLQSCVQSSPYNTLCEFSQPLYTMKAIASLCEIHLVNVNPDVNACKLESLSNCQDRWIKLHRQYAWLYTCCEKCNVRIYCPSGVSVKVLTGSGIIDLGLGCSIKTNFVDISAHHDFLSQIDYQPEISVPEVSILNAIINSSLPVDWNTSMEEHSLQLDQLSAQIKDIKEQSATTLTVHDISQYSVIGCNVALGLVVMIVVIVVARKLRRRRHREERGTAAQVHVDTRQKVYSVSDSNIEVTKPSVVSVSDSVSEIEVHRSVPRKVRFITDANNANGHVILD